MPNSYGMTVALKQDALKLAIALADTIKGALYGSTANIGPSTLTYTSTGEAVGSGYVAGGATVTHANDVGLTGTTAHWTPSAAISWPSVTLTDVDCLLLYNFSRSNRTLGAYVFGSVTVVAAAFSLAMPNPAAATALLRIV